MAEKELSLSEVKTKLKTLSSMEDKWKLLKGISNDVLGKLGEELSSEDFKAFQEFAKSQK